MKRILLTSVVLASSLLAACGGGGSTPIPVVTNPPKPTTYSVTLKYSGGAQPRSAQVALLRIQSTAQATSATPPPILLVAPDNTNGMAQFQPGTGDSQTIATAVVAPNPSSSPSASWSGGDANVSVAAGTQPLTAVVNANALNHSDATAVLASVTIPGSTPIQVQPNVYEYARLTTSCNPNDESSAPNANEWTSGVVFDASGNPTVASNPASADIYVDGPNCYGAFQNASETVETLHMPYGGHVYVDGFKALNLLTPADYQGDLTSISFSTMFDTGNNPPSDTVTFKDAVGRIHFWFITHAETPYGKNSGGTKTCNGAAIDGSC